MYSPVNSLNSVSFYLGRVPEFVQEKRFHNWLENAHDWNVSRNRYWGTPIPLWVSEDYEEVCLKDTSLEKNGHFQDLFLNIY